MKKKEWTIVFLALIIPWAFDHLTKLWASQLSGYYDFKLILFSLHYNPGAMLGFFSDLPAILRIVSLSTGGAFLFCIYVLLQYLLPIRSMTLRIGMSFLLSGVLGNVTDRILWGHVVDFIIFRFGTYLTPVFNIADAIQWVGYVLISYSIIKEGEILWPENDQRNSYWINKKFQLKYATILMGVGLGMSFIMTIFSYTFLKVTIQELVGTNLQIQSKFLGPFVITSTLMIFGSMIILFTAGKIISHKIAGPIFAFEKFIKELIEFKSQDQQNKPLRKFKLRSKDEFKNLENIADDLKKSLLPDVAQTLPVSDEDANMI